MDAEMATEVYRCLGEASACWERPGWAGEFDSARVEQIGRGLIASLDQHYACELAPYRIIADTLISLKDETGVEAMVDTQMLCLAEETGEAVKAWRRLTGRARVSDTMEHLLEELADVIIVARVTFLLLQADEREALRNKLLAIVERGGR